MPNANTLDIRYVILTKKENIEEFDFEEFELVRKMECLFNEDYMLAVIKAKDELIGYTLDDIMEITDAVAIHEEYTKGIITTENRFDELSDIYCWSGSGSCLLADMLTETERLSCLLQKLYIEEKENIDIDDIGISISKENVEIPLSNNIDKLFSNDINSIYYKGNQSYLWWPTVIEELGFFLVVLDEEDFNNDEIWGNIYDDDFEPGHYIDDYYAKRGIF